MNQSKINSLKLQIQAYQAQYPRRTWKQKHELNQLWIELLYYQLLEAGEIQIDPLYLKAQEFWETLKKSYQNKGRWPYPELKLFLPKQPLKYTEYLINFVEQENNKKYSRFIKWLNRRILKNPT